MSTVSTSERAAGDTVNVRRSLILCSIGALAGLGIAAYGLFTAQGTSLHTVAPENVATVNQRPILRSDFITQSETETGKHFEDTTRDAQLKVLDEMVREELLVQRGLELDFAETDQNVRNALAASISDQAVAEVTTGQPADQQLRDFFARAPERWSSEGVMTLRHFLLPKAANRSDAQDRELARMVGDALRTGMSPEQTLARFSLQELPRQEQEFYFVIQFRLGDALFAAISLLAKGDVSDPVKLPDGIHLVLMVNNTRPVPQKFESVRAQVLSDFNDDAQARLMENTLRFLRERASILIAPDYVSDYRR